jgi:predicted amidophosphoribosyltransferase
MTAPTETCENCGVPIGALETPRVWNEHVVCPTCWQKLKAQEAPRVLDLSEEPDTRGASTASGDRSAHRPPSALPPRNLVRDYPPSRYNVGRSSGGFCPNCNGPISFTTTTCPSCGKTLFGRLLLIAVPILFIIVYAMMH